MGGASDRPDPSSSDTALATDRLMAALELSAPNPSVDADNLPELERTKDEVATLLAHLNRRIEDAEAWKRRFRSALGEDLAVLVLQYAMYDEEAEKTLASDRSHGLAHLYQNHQGGFMPTPGLQVTGAGNTEVNGWYRRREASEGPPTNCRLWCNQEKWIRITAGKPWFEKDDGHVIRWSVSPYSWLPDTWRCIGLVSAIYIAHADTALPPSEGWKGNPHSSPRVGYHPGPTLRVVS